MIPSIEMPLPSDDPLTLQIRCPSCGQRFKVDAELRNRTVECGSCEHRFRVNDDVIFKARRYYPGERQNPTLNRFQRVPMASPIPSNMQAVEYADTPDPIMFEPASPQRVLAGTLGAAAMAVVALLFVFGSGVGGLLEGTPLISRLVMAGFVAVVATVMLCYANPRARFKAFSLSLLLSAGLVALPFLMFEGVESQPGEDTAIVESPVMPVTVPEEPDPMADLRREIGTGPLDAENERLAASGSEWIAIGLWLRDLSETNRHMVRDYFLRTTPADPVASYIYPRFGGDYLMVISGIRPGYVQQLAAVADRLGRTERIHHGINVIEVRVDNAKLVGPPLEHLTVKDHPLFYEANIAELESIDPDRLAKAARRLAEAEPNVYRSDVSNRLLELLSDNDAEIRAAAARALVKWAEDPAVAGAEAAKLASQLRADGEPVPESVIELAVLSKEAAIVPIVDDLWFANPPLWESKYGDLGEIAEAPLLARIPEANAGVRHSLIRILGRIGGEPSLLALEAMEADADGEMLVMIQRARETILERGGRQEN